MATQGFEPFGKTSGEEVFWLPGNPGTTYTRGDMVCIGGAVGEASPTAGLEGVLKQVATANVNAIGAVMRTTTCPAASVAFPKPKDFDPVYGRGDGGATDTLVPVKLNVAAGHQVWLATVASFATDTVVSWTAGTRAIAATTGHTADDYPNGGLVWFTGSGPGAGELNIVEDYDHSGGAAELLVIIHRATSATLTASSTYSVLSGEAAASRGISLLGRLDAGDQNNLVANDGANDGEYVLFADWFTIYQHLQDSTDVRLPVINRRAIYGA